ncbi:hypothetical protein [Microbacterium aerolatum]|uniref:hypothetical protein n=1 Tax=Microbacterium aerolatum TaxID=153731 RepID=UPI00384BBF8B
MTVRMLVRYVAHVDGGVHLGKPSDDFELYLQDGLANFRLIARGMLLDTLASVGTVVLRALEPMARELAKERN